MSKVKLKPCPFCGATEHEESGGVELLLGLNNKAYFVMCFNCFAKGVASEDSGRAVELWNRRADEVVRCRECVSYVRVNVPRGRGLCKILGKQCKDTDYCSMGQRG